MSNLIRYGVPRFPSSFGWTAGTRIVTPARTDWVLTFTDDAGLIDVEAHVPTVSYVQNLFAGHDTVNSIALALTGSATVTVGNTMFVAFSSNPSIVSGTINAVDDLGNTWSLVSEIKNGSGTSGVYSALLSAPITTGGTLTLISIGWTGTNVAYAAVSAEYKGITARNSTDSSTGSASVDLFGNAASESVATGEMAVMSAAIENSTVISGAASGSTGQVSIVRMQDATPGAGAAAVKASLVDLIATAPNSFNTTGAGHFGASTTTTVNSASTSGYYACVSGTNWTQTVDDSTGLTDTRAISFTDENTDSAGLVDSIVLERIFTDSAGSTDLFAYGPVLTDSSGLTDSIVLERIFTDSAGLADSIIRGEVFTDSAGLVDTVAISFMDENTDSVGLADSTFLGYPAEVISDFPNGYWRQGEPSGTSMLDSSGHGYNGTYVNSPTLATTGLVSGSSDTAVTYTRASSQYGSVTDSGTKPLLDFTSAATFEAIVQPAGISGEGHIVNKNHYNLIQTTDQFRLELELNDGSNFNRYSVYTNMRIIAGKKYIVSGVYDKPGAQLLIYVNGMLDNTTSVPSGRNITTNDDPLVIGANYNLIEFFFDGVIDEVSVTSSTLSATRILARALAAGFKNVSQTDTTGLTDTRAYSFTDENTDASGLADTVVIDRSLVFTDSAAPTDSALVERIQIVTQDDSAGLVDTQVFDRNLVQTDSAGLADLASYLQGIVRTEDSGLTDTPSFVLNLVFTDSSFATPSDSAIASLVTSVTQTDTTGLIDTSTVSQGFGIPQTDSAGSTDSTTVSQGWGVSQTDSAGSTDTASRGIGPVLTDGSGSVDSLAFSLNLVLTDSALAASPSDDVTLGGPVNFSDDFNRADGALGSNWLSTSVPMTIASNQVVGTTALSAARWVDDVGTADQYSQATYLGTGLLIGVAVAMPSMSGSPTYIASGTWYTVRQATASAGIALVQKDAGAASSTTLATYSTNLIAGDVLRLEYQSGVLTTLINGSVVLTYTPSSPITGQRGVGFVHTRNSQSGVALIDDWSGGDLGPTNWSRTFSDTAALSDSVGLASQVFLNFTDSAGLDDPSPVVSHGWVLSQSDAENTSDSLVLDKSLAPTDLAGLSDSATTQFSAGLLVSVDDSTGSTDTQVFSLTVTVTDSTGLVDGTDTGTIFTDSVGLADSAVASAAHQVTQTDSTGSVDSASALVTRLVTATDSSGFTDQAVYDRASVFAESVGLVDLATEDLTTPSGTDWTEGPEDSAGLIDSFTVNNIRPPITPTDPLGLSDLATPTLTTGISFSESFEGGADGVQASTATTLFTGANTGAGLTHSTNRAILGSTSLHILTPSSQANLYYTTSVASLVYRRIYIYLNASTTNYAFWSARIGSSIIARISVAATLSQRVLELRDVNTTVANTTSINLGQWYRLEWRLNGSTGVQTLRLYGGADLHANGTPTQEISGLLTATGFDRLEVGTVGQSVSADTYIDAYADSSANWIGPAITSSGPSDITDMAFAPVSDEVTFDLADVESDSAGLTDSVVLAQSKSFTDSAGLSDSASCGFDPLPTDTLSLIDSITISHGFGVSPTDSAGLVDSRVYATSVSATDTLALTDSILEAPGRVITDGVGLADTIQQVSGIGLIFTDSMTATSPVAASAVPGRARPGVARPGLLGAQATDQVILFREQVSQDSLGLSDLVTINLSGSQSLTLDDSAGLADTSTLVFARALTQTDSTGLTDFLGQNFSLTPADNVGLGDLFSSAFGRGVPQTDSAGLIDSLALTLSRTLTDALDLSDPASTIGTYQRTFTDSAGLIDGASAGIVGQLFPVTVFDDAGLVDVPLLTEAWDRTDSTGLTDTKSIGQTIVVGDRAGITDSPVNTGLAGTTTDSLSLIDSATALKPLPPTFSREPQDSSALSDGSFDFDFDTAVDDDAGLDEFFALTLNLFINDSAGATDGIVLGQALARTPNDSTGLVDSQSKNFSDVLSDSVGLFDSADIGAPSSKFVTPPPDSVGLGDTFSLSRGEVSADTETLRDTPVNTGIAGTTTDLQGLTDKADLVKTFTPTIFREFFDTEALSDGTFNFGYDLDADDDEGSGDSFRIVPLKVGVLDIENLSDIALLVLTRERTDPEGLTDNVAFTRELVVTDSVGLADPAPSVVIPTLNRVLDDTETLTDLALVVLQPLVTDTETITDSISLGLGRGMTDVESLIDEQVFVADRVATYLDIENLADPFTVALGFVRSFTDGAGLADVATKNFTDVTDDAAGLIDQANASFVASVLQTDSTGLTDTALLTLTRGVTDPVGLTDSQVYSASRTFTDSSGLADETQIAGTGHFTTTDSVTLTDDLALVREMIVDNPAGTADDTVQASDRVVTANDPLTLSDSIDQTHSLVVTDAASLLDDAATPSSRVVSLDDLLNLTDTSALQRFPVVDDPINLTDSTVFSLAAVQGDDVGLTDSVNVVLAANRTLTDAAGISDTLFPVIGHEVTATDPVNLTDAASSTIEGAPEITDPVDLTDVVVIVHDVVLEFTEDVGLIDYDRSIVVVDTQVYPPEARTLRICAEDRVLRIMPELRILPIEPEFRRHVVRPDDVPSECDTC